MRNDNPTIFAIAPDKQTAAAAKRALERAGLPLVEIAHTEKGATKLLPRLLSSEKGVVVAVLASSYPNLALEVASAATSRGRLALCMNDLLDDGPANRDGWLLGQLLAQRGCLSCPDLSTAVEAIRAHLFCGHLAPPRIKRQERKSAIGKRLEEIAARRGLLADTDDRGEALLLEIAKDGIVSLRRKGARLELSHPEVSLAALSILASRPVPLAREDTASPFDSDVVDLIVQPPRRLLSEITSKRLAAAFGIALPDERLSTSPTESVRFEAELGPRLVLKLVRPALEDKAARGAVVMGARGAAAIRQSHHTLLSVGESLGPPPPLGVLVAREVVGGARLWLAMARHPALGALVIGGTGDRPSLSPDFALAAPATSNEAKRALERIGLTATSIQRSALATAISRFSVLVSELGPRIDRAEIHPLVALDDGPALALDVLIGIAD
jgi:hypothetical protein